MTNDEPSLQTATLERRPGLRDLDHRGFLKPGMFADVVVSDPQTIADRATFEQPHQYLIGVKHVLVNGVQVHKDGEHRYQTRESALGAGNQIVAASNNAFGRQ